jgi:hypothetical protein
LRLASATGTWWRIDARDPAAWDWMPFPDARHRFDPPSGRFRVRYAANLPAVAARERFPARLINETDGDLYLIRLAEMPSALHLTHQANLDALGLDDRVSTGRVDLDRTSDPDPLLDISGQLADAVYDWWHAQPPPLVYRSRTTPSGRNIAFTQTSAPRVVQTRRLREATALHAHLVLRAGFTLPDAWLATEHSLDRLR